MTRIFLALAILPALALSACAIGPAPSPAAGAALTVTATAVEIAMQLEAADLARDLDAGSVAGGGPAHARLGDLDRKLLALGTARAAIDLRFASRSLSVPDAIGTSRGETDQLVHAARSRLVDLIAG